MWRLLASVMILLGSLLPYAESWAEDFAVLDVALAGSIQDRQPVDPASPPAHCEKDKNGEGAPPVIDSATIPKVFFWTRIASPSKAQIRHTWLQQLEGGWQTISQVDLPISPSSGYRMWSSKAMDSGHQMGDWMITVAPSHDPEHILCITRFSVK